MKNENNLAFIDGQNLHMGTTTGNTPWKVDLYKFRVYLEKKYVDEFRTFNWGKIEKEINFLQLKSVSLQIQN